MQTSVKTCFKCFTEKPLLEFYVHKQMGDGHLNKCKECALKDVREHRAANLEKVRAYDRMRCGQAHRMAARAAYGRTATGKLVQRAAQRKWDANNPEKKFAQTTLNNLVRDGKLERQACWVCGAEAEAHHVCYEDPLMVSWLCDPHHKEVHKLARELKRLG